MGQLLRKYQADEEDILPSQPNTCNRQVLPRSFPDLSNLPPEISLKVLSHLNATDLCLAACVWQQLAGDQILWHSLCRNQWKYVSAYAHHGQPGFCFKKLYLQLDEATLTFNADSEEGMCYLFENRLIMNTPAEVAKFFHGAKHLSWQGKRDFLQKRQDVLDQLVLLQNFDDQFLPNALRTFFRETNPPNERNDYLSILVEKFSERFCSCNPHLGLCKDTVYVACFSLIMLSVDLSSPHIKNKMSKREFIRNTRRAAAGLNDDLAGHLYDNIYLVGHIAPQA